MRNRAVKTIEPNTYVTSHEAASMLQSNPSTINKWVKEGRIHAHTTPGGHRRIRAADLVAFLVEYDMPVPESLAPAAPSASSPKAKTSARKK